MKRLAPLEEVVRYLHHHNEPSDGYTAFLSRLAAPVIARVAPGSRGLDYGCGPVPVLGDLLTRWGMPTQSYDPLFRADEALVESSYDFVTCSEVVEHAHHPDALFSRLEELVRPGGIIAVMTSFHSAETPFETWWYRRDPSHACFFAPATMSWIAASRGWSLEMPAPNVSLFTTPPDSTTPSRAQD